MQTIAIALTTQAETSSRTVTTRSELSQISSQSYSLPIVRPSCFQSGQNKNQSQRLGIIPHHRTLECGNCHIRKNNFPSNVASGQAIIDGQNRSRISFDAFLGHQDRPLSDARKRRETIGSQRASLPGRMAAVGQKRPIRRCRPGTSFTPYVVGVCLNRISMVSTSTMQFPDLITRGQILRRFDAQLDKPRAKLD